MKLDSGHEVKPLDEAEFEKIKRDFPDRSQLVTLTPGRWLVNADFQKFANRIYNFQLRETDVVVMTYPKCGTTWTQEIVWTMRNNANLDHPKAHIPIRARAPFIEYDMAKQRHFDSEGKPLTGIYKEFLERCPGKDPEDGVNLQLAECTPDPRTIKTHLPFSLMPPSMLQTCKVVYCARNPKDVIVSFHHHMKNVGAAIYKGTFESYVDHFLNGNIVYSPYWLHLKEAWERKNHPNLHIIFYEDLKANTLEELKKLNTFLDTQLTEKQLEGIVKHTSFSEMKTREEKEDRLWDQRKLETMTPEEKERYDKQMENIKREGGFYRKGVVGDWKNRFTPEIDGKVNRWIQEHLSDSCFSFKYGN